MRGLWSEALSEVYRIIIYVPLYNLYFKGPTALGFWGGAAPEDICFLLTGTTSVFWTTHSDECTLLIQQHFNSFLVIIQLFLYILMWFRILQSMSFYMTVTKPILKELKQLQHMTITHVHEVVN